MKQQKDNTFKRLNKPFFEFIKEEEGEVHNGVYMKILEQIENKINSKYNFSLYRDNPNRTVVSGYSDIIIDSNTDEYTSFRVSDHFPVIDNVFSKFPVGHPSSKTFAHMCILLFGFEEWKQLNRVQKGFYALSKDDSKIIVETEEDYNRIKDYYRHNSSIPYHIYHYIPALLTDNDVDEIVKSSETWFDNKGNSAFSWPIPENPIARPMSQPIEAKMVFVFSKNLQNKLVKEDLSNVFVEGGSEPITRFHIRDIRYISPDKKRYFRISVYLDIMNCEAYVVQLINKFQELFKLSKKKKVYLRKFKKNIPPKK